jgi:hypothetical protein
LSSRVTSLAYNGLNIERAELFIYLYAIIERANTGGEGAASEESAADTLTPFDHLRTRTSNRYPITRALRASPRRGLAQLIADSGRVRRPSRGSIILARKPGAAPRQLSPAAILPPAIFSPRTSARDAAAARPRAFAPSSPPRPSTHRRITEPPVQRRHPFQAVDDHWSGPRSGALPRKIGRCVTGSGDRPPPASRTCPDFQNAAPPFRPGSLVHQRQRHPGRTEPALFLPDQMCVTVAGRHRTLPTLREASARSSATLSAHSLLHPKLYAREFTSPRSRGKLTRCLTVRINALPYGQLI